MLRREPMLSSRVLVWQEMQGLSDEEVLTVIPSYHPIWRDADPEVIVFANTSAAHGNFRAWARITVLADHALRESGRATVDRQVLGWVFSRLGGEP
ncbi:hypothetical protein [Actinomadura montaniterrae]|uniref:Uncharacterized protein n=1 Tax=Actinomadura montaniterrae TaxID=1803903 RepID=A0A6L3W2R7_9ACTN|nr:hypothetical protein [Actinomadura montaniterrae]KAB2384859.1 hypothetical protein F9B16_09530 [Actinomadura montaniterrae]